MKKDAPINHSNFKQTLKESWKRSPRLRAAVWSQVCEASLKASCENYKKKGTRFLKRFYYRLSGDQDRRGHEVDVNSPRTVRGTTRRAPSRFRYGIVEFRPSQSQDAERPPRWIINHVFCPS
jgi:hypothetical protein